MEIIVLGSGTAAPMADRNMAGYLLYIKNKKILFDSGPGTIRQLLKLNISLLNINHIFYTHLHNDHINDLPAIIWSNNYGILRKKALYLYGPKGFKKYFKHLMRKILKPTKLYYKINVKEMRNNSIIKIPINSKSLMEDDEKYSITKKVNKKISIKNKLNKIISIINKINDNARENQRFSVNLEIQKEFPVSQKSQSDFLGSQKSPISVKLLKRLSIKNISNKMISIKNNNDKNILLNNNNKSIIKKINNKELLKNRDNKNEIIIRSIKSNHTDNSVSYKIEFNDKSIVYSGDTDYSKEIVNLSQNADLLILECSFPDNKKVKGHLIPSLCGKIATKANVKKLVLTHFYPECDKADIIKQCAKEFNGKIVLAKDFMSINV